MGTQPTLPSCIRKLATCILNTGRLIFCQEGRGARVLMGRLVVAVDAWFHQSVCDFVLLDSPGLQNRK